MIDETNTIFSHLKLIKTALENKYAKHANNKEKDNIESGIEDLT